MARSKKTKKKPTVTQKQRLAQEKKETLSGIVAGSQQFRQALVKNIAAKIF